MNRPLLKVEFKVPLRTLLCFCLFLLGTNTLIRGDSCPGIDNYPSGLHLAAVTCCDLDGNECMTPDKTCYKAEFDKAKELCTSIGKRVCTPSELGSGLCCDSGCNFDNKLTWQSKYNGVL